MIESQRAQLGSHECVRSHLGPIRIYVPQDFEMDPSQHVHYMPDGRRLTAERVAGFALEVAFVCLVSYGLFDLVPSMWETVDILGCSPKRSEATARTACFRASQIHVQMVMDAVNDIAARLQHAGYTIVKAVVKQEGHRAAHDLVLEVRKIGQHVLGQYSGELKLRTAPANRLRMRGDCAGLFQAACRCSTKWLGQLVISVEMDNAGRFIRSRAELIVRGQSRDQAINVWGWEGRPAAAPFPQSPQITGNVQAQAKATAMVKALARSPARPVQPLKRAWTAIWDELDKYSASWSSEPVALLQKCLIAMGPVCRAKVKKVDRVVQDNRNALRWRLRAHYAKAGTRAEGRVNHQGGARMPYIVCKSALKQYYDTL